MYQHSVNRSHLSAHIYSSPFISFPTGPKPTKCQEAYLEALRSYLPGRFIPRCKKDGKFEAIQQQGPDAYCVDDGGKEIAGTRVTRPFKPKCVVGRFPRILIPTKYNKS